MKLAVSGLLILLGAGAVLYGVFAINQPAGFMLAGCYAFGVGLCLARAK